MNNEIKEIREYIACPQFGDDHYGRWGALRLEQRITIKSLLDYITNLEKNLDFMIDINNQRQDRIDETIELLERYNDKENNYYVPLDEAINKLRGEDK